MFAGPGGREGGREGIERDSELISDRPTYDPHVSPVLPPSPQTEVSKKQISGADFLKKQVNKSAEIQTRVPQI